MENRKRRIVSDCALFACKVCRTKAGWPHQSWCALAQAVRPGCGDCRYWIEAEEACGHPSHRKGGDGR